MSLLVKKERKKKRKFPRQNHRSYHLQNRLQAKRKIYRVRGWKLQYPHLFKEIIEYPYIIKI